MSINFIGKLKFWLSKAIIKSQNLLKSSEKLYIMNSSWKFQGHKTLQKKIMSKRIDLGIFSFQE